MQLEDVTVDLHTTAIKYIRSSELTGSTWIYTDNDDFFGGNMLESQPLYALQTHTVYHFLPTQWASGSLGFGIGQESTASGDHEDDRRENIVIALSFFLPDSSLSSAFASIQ